MIINRHVLIASGLFKHPRQAEQWLWKCSAYSAPYYTPTSLEDKHLIANLDTTRLRSKLQALINNPLAKAVHRKHWQARLDKIIEIEDYYNGKS